MRNSQDFVFEYLDIINELPVKRILLPDTLGILSPDETFKYVSSSN